MAKRYEQLMTLIDLHKPKVIVEVGVHRAMRGMKMCQRALIHREKVNYIGFDVFETETPEFQEQALNGKGIPLQADAEARMKGIAQKHEQFSWQFVVGDTNSTLHDAQIKCDFAFIDGDHRVEVIRGDAAALDCPVLVFDDYYQPLDGQMPDVEKFGANKVVAEMEAAGARVTILPAADKCKHGGVAHLAVVIR